MTTMTFDRTTTLGLLVHRLAKQFNRALERALGRHGVAPGHFKIMMTPVGRRRAESKRGGASA